jgi:hypothetical protein
MIGPIVAGSLGGIVSAVILSSWHCIVGQTAPIRDTDCKQAKLEKIRPDALKRIKSPNRI